MFFPMIRLWLISVANTSRMASNGHLRSLDRADTSYICIYSTTVSIPFAGAHLFTRITQNGDLPQLWPLRMQTRGHLIQKRPRISTYLSESFSAICWIFSETFWLSKYENLARLIKKWPRRPSQHSPPVPTVPRGYPAGCPEIRRTPFLRG